MCVVDHIFEVTIDRFKLDMAILIYIQFNTYSADSIFCKVVLVYLEEPLEYYMAYTCTF